MKLGAGQDRPVPLRRFWSFGVGERRPVCFAVGDETSKKSPLRASRVLEDRCVPSSGTVVANSTDRPVRDPPTVRLADSANAAALAVSGIGFGPCSERTKCVIAQRAHEPSLLPRL